MRTAGPELRLAAGTSGERAVDRAWAAHRIALELAAVELTGALRAAGVDAILLKGPVTAARQWPDRFRPTLDLDLMVAPARFETALACLAGRGFTPIAANERANALRRDRDAVTVDLHRTLSGATVAPERAWAELARRRVPFPLAGAEVAALDEAAHACHLAMHAAQTGGTKPKPAADLDRAVARVPRDLGGGTRGGRAPGRAGGDGGRAALLRGGRPRARRRPRSARGGLRRPGPGAGPDPLDPRPPRLVGAGWAGGVGAPLAGPDRGLARARLAEPDVPRVAGRAAGAGRVRGVPGGAGRDRPDRRDPGRAAPPGGTDAPDQAILNGRRTPPRSGSPTMQRFLEHGHTGTAGPEGPPPEVSARLARARVARLATLHDTAPRVSPVTFAWTRGRVVWAVDDHKAKTGRRLRRLADIAADPRVSVLVDHYEEDWSALWWIEVLGTAAELRGHEATAALDALAARYPAYAERRPPGPVVGITPVAWRWWQAAD